MFFFEIKWRVNRQTGKYRFKYNIDCLLSELPYEQILNKFSLTLPDRFKNLVQCNLEPVLFVKYDREHFVGRHDDVRLTLDYNVRFYDQRCKRKMSQGRMTLTDDVIVEFKSSVDEEYKLKKYFYPYRPMRTRSSKYVNGCNLLGILGKYSGVYD